jgi:hypothetical protein
MPLTHCAIQLKRTTLSTAFYIFVLLFALCFYRRIYLRHIEAGKYMTLSNEIHVKVAPGTPPSCASVSGPHDSPPLPFSPDVTAESNISCSGGSSLCKGEWHKVSDSVQVCHVTSSVCLERGIPLGASCIILRLSAAECHISNHPSQAIVGLGKCGTSFLYWFSSHFVHSPRVKENCLATTSHALDWINTSVRSKNWIGGCISPHFWLKLHSIVQPVNVNYFMAVRHVATFSWAAFNFWNFPLDRHVQKSNTWAKKDVNYRSSALFHELVLSHGSVDFRERLSWNKSSQNVELGMGYSTHTDFFSRNMTLLVLPSELFSSQALMTVLASKLGRIAPHCVNQTLVAQLVDRKVNLGASAKTKGVGAVSLGQLKDGLYEISSYSPMLPATCTHLTQSWIPSCKRLNGLIRSSFDRIGISYGRDPYDCLSYHYCM